MSRLKINELRFTEGHIWLYLGDDRERQRGQILGSLVTPMSERSRVYADLQALETVTRVYFRKPCVVLNVRLDDDLLNLGYGIRLYAELAKVAAERFKAPIVSGAYVGSVTSSDALRTWASKRLADRVIVQGESAWGGAIKKSP